MAIVPTNLARVSNLLRTSVTTQGLSKTQAALLKVQNQITTGYRVNTPSEDAGAASIIMQLQKTLENRAAFLDNVSRASSQLAQTESTIGDVTELIQEAQTIASANVGSGVTAEARAGAAELVKGIYSQMLALGNTQFGGAYLFAGDGARAPFEEALGGIRFVGTSGQLANRYDESTTGVFNVGASDVFGQVEARAGLGATLTPSLSLSTRLADLAGANGTGVQRGAIVVSDGTDSVTVDLTDAETVGDVITRINNAGLTGITAAIDGAGAGIELTASGGENITVIEATDGGTTASDLGILRTVGLGAGAALTGSSPNPKLSEFTPLTTINGGTVDWGSGIVITNGVKSATLSFATDTTVQDVLARINNSGTGVRAGISADGSGIEIYNTVEGTSLTIGENGGSTATQLGIRTLAGGTQLSSLNGGKGVRLTGTGGPGLRITRADGADVDVDLAGATSVNDVLAAINAAGGGTVTASLAANGNGIVITDISGGVGTTSVSSINGSGAAEDLGLNVAAVAGVVAGKDVAPVQASGVFTHLANLRDALQRGDQQGITAAAEALKADYELAVRTRGTTGAKVQDLENRKSRIEDQNLATAGALANLREVDLTEAITRFQMLQTALQASLQSAAKSMNLSLLDFLS